MTNQQTERSPLPAPSAAPRRTDPDRLLLTVRQAAELLAIGRTTAYELIAAGELEVVHIGRSARVPVDAVDALVTRLRRQAS